jgi:hypothetical protein
MCVWFPGWGCVQRVLIRTPSVFIIEHLRVEGDGNLEMAGHFAEWPRLNVNEARNNPVCNKQIGM